MRKKLAAILAGTIVFSTVFLFLMPHIPSALAQFSWTDTINLYKDVTAVYADIRKITNNETVSVDVRVYLTSTEKIELLEYYRLSGNGTDFIIISGGEIPLSNGTYYGLELGQTLHFTVEAKGSSSLSMDDVVEVGVRVEFWSAEYEHDVAITGIGLSKTVVGQGYGMHIDVTVQNQGNYTETFNVTCYANAVVIQTQTVTDLVSGDSTLLVFEWNTTGMIFGNYTIKAVADIIEEEINIEDNTLVNGDAMVTIPGDVNGDRTVDIFDVGYISAHWYPGPPIGPLGYDASADINNDGAVDIFDIGIASAHWGESW